MGTATNRRQGGPPTSKARRRRGAPRPAWAGHGRGQTPLLKRQVKDSARHVGGRPALRNWAGH
eukprot:10659648-Lingulodinium_polyedra.AAC.1